MNRQMVLLAISFMLMVPQVHAAPTQYPDPARQTMWNNITDSVHTIGQSPQQAQLTKRRLYNARYNARVRSVNQARQQAWLHARGN